MTGVVFSRYHCMQNYHIHAFLDVKANESLYEDLDGGGRGLKTPGNCTSLNLLKSVPKRFTVKFLVVKKFLGAKFLGADYMENFHPRGLTQPC